MRFLTCAVTALAISISPALAGADMLSPGKPAGVHQAQSAEISTPILIAVGLGLAGLAIGVLASHDHQGNGASGPPVVINTTNTTP
jgi:hypothetical protein